MLKLGNPDLDRPSNSAGNLVHLNWLIAWLRPGPLIPWASPPRDKGSHCLIMILSHHESQRGPPNHSRVWLAQWPLLSLTAWDPPSRSGPHTCLICLWICPSSTAGPYIPVGRRHVLLTSLHPVCHCLP